MSPPDERIRDLAKSLASLTRRAVADSLVRGRSVDVREIERALDGLLDFCFDEEMLILFKQLCRHYHRIDPAATAAYIVAYRELWDSDSKETR